MLPFKGSTVYDVFRRFLTRIFSKKAKAASDERQTANEK
jgi:hypothetical protein